VKNVYKYRVRVVATLLRLSKHVDPVTLVTCLNDLAFMNWENLYFLNFLNSKQVIITTCLKPQTLKKQRFRAFNALGKQGRRLSDLTQSVPLCGTIQLNVTEITVRSPYLRKQCKKSSDKPNFTSTKMKTGSFNLKVFLNGFST